MRKMKQRWTLELTKLFTLCLAAALIPAAFTPAVSAQDYAGPSPSGSDSAAVPGMVNSGAAGAGYAHSAPNFWGNRGGFNSAGVPNISQPPAVGFDMGHSGYVNGGNNGGQSAVQLPASNCCGKATRNSAYYASKYAGYNLFPTPDAPGMNANASNSVPGLNTAGGGAGFGSNPANGFANSRMSMPMRSSGSMGSLGRGANGIPGQMSVPGQSSGSF